MPGQTVKPHPISRVFFQTTAAEQRGLSVNRGGMLWIQGALKRGGVRQSPQATTAPALNPSQERISASRRLTLREVANGAAVLDEVVLGLPVIPLVEQLRTCHLDVLHGCALGGMGVGRDVSGDVLI